MYGIFFIGSLIFLLFFPYNIKKTLKSVGFLPQDREDTCHPIWTTCSSKKNTRQKGGNLCFLISSIVEDRCYSIFHLSLSLATISWIMIFHILKVKKKIADRRQANQCHQWIYHTSVYEKLYHWPKGHKTELVCKPIKRIISMSSCLIRCIINSLPRASFHGRSRGDKDSFCQRVLVFHMILCCLQKFFSALKQTAIKLIGLKAK